MIRVKIDTIRANLKGSDRVVLLKETQGNRYLPIYIHPIVAEAITNELEGKRHPRPLTHDLLKNCLVELGAELEYILVNKLQRNTFYAVLHLVQEGRSVDIDARPSDSIALAVRAQVPIYVSPEVMEEAGIYPSEEIEDREQLAVFRDFVETLDLGDLQE